MLYQVEVLMLYNVQPTILTFVGKKNIEMHNIQL